MNARKERNERSDSIASVATREAVFATNVDVVISMVYCALPRRRRCAVDTLALRCACADAQLPTLLHCGIASVAAGGRVGYRSIELALDESVVRVWSTSGDGCFVDDAGPDGGQREEDADDGEDNDAELGDVVAELEACEDGWDVLAEYR